MPEDSKHKQADLIHFNDNIPQIDSCSSSQTNKQIEHIDDVSYSTLIDRCHDYPSDPYLFIDTVLTPQIIRTLVEIGPCQHGFNSNNYIFEENESGKKFSSNWYNKDVKSGMSCKRNWLVYSPKVNKMFVFLVFCFDLYLKILLNGLILIKVFLISVKDMKKLLNMKNLRTTEKQKMNI